MEIWHNPRCSKSREALRILTDAGTVPVVRRYLETPPTVEELDAALQALDSQPWDIARMSEPVARELGMASWPHERDRWIAAMVDNPILIERPIVIADGGRAVLGRPPEDVAALL